MRYVILSTVLVLGLAAVAVAATTDPTETPKYWQLRGCTHGHPTGGDKGSYSVVKRVLRNLQPLNKGKASRLPHYAVCVATKAKSRAVWDFIRRSYEWRKQYSHVWWIKFHSLAPWEQSWAWNTGACESGNNPFINTGNGFLGAHQWVLSTWHAAVRAAGYVGPWSPLQATWPHQAYIAVVWLHVAGAGQWPVCGH